MSEVAESKWCRRCGGPLHDRRCSNCATVESRRWLGQAISARIKEGRAFEYRDLLGGLPFAESWKDPVDAVLDALLPRGVDGAFEIRLRIGTRSRISLSGGDAPQQGLTLPPLIALHCVGHLELLRGMASRLGSVSRRSKDGAREFAIELSDAKRLMIRRVA